MRRLERHDAGVLDKLDAKKERLRYAMPENPSRIMVKRE
jgi:hypothetical protein